MHAAPITNHFDDRPHLVNPSIGKLRVVQAIKNFAKVKGVSHIGLGITALCNMKTLRRYGIRIEAWPVETAQELKDKLEEDKKANGDPISHVIVSAPSWVQPDDFSDLCSRWQDTEFVQLNHSGCAYLSIDKFGIRNIRRCIDLEHSLHNLRVAGNNPRFTSWSAETFGFNCLLLPNLYDVSSFVTPYTRRSTSSPLRIGSFGASRPWKNQLTAAEAAAQIGRRLGVDVELYVNSKRPDGGERMVEARAELFDQLAGCKIVEVPWQPWPQFRDTVSKMHIMFSPSFDETFCVVVADGIAEGVSSVVTNAMEWAPDSWQSKTPEDPSDLVAVAINLLHNPHAVEEGRKSLTRFVQHGLDSWFTYLLGNSSLWPTPVR